MRLLLLQNQPAFHNFISNKEKEKELLQKKRSYTGTVFDDHDKSDPSNNRQRATDQEINYL
jgi:hypothetical protein